MLRVVTIRSGALFGRTSYTSHEVARQSITDEITRFYQTNYPEINRARHSEVQQAGQEVANIYLRNIFPDMHVVWASGRRSGRQS